jgi:mannose-6-phosphate isomerase-like protein (cupin superfamily)
LKGVLVVHIGLKSDGQPESTFILSEGESMRIEPSTIHRFCAPQDGFVELVEVSTPEIEDVVRLQDDFNRT